MQEEQTQKQDIKDIRDIVQDMKEWQIRHQTEDTAEFKSIRSTLDTIKDNHLEHIARDISEIKHDAKMVSDEVVATRQDVRWLKRAFWVVFASSLSGVVSLLITLLAFVLNRR